MKKIWLTHTLVLCFLISLIAVGVYAGISTEVGTYVWDAANSRWTKLLGSSSGAITLGNKTPADSYTNPTDAINTVGLNMAYDNANAKWMMLRTMGSSGVAPVGTQTLATGIILWDATAATTRLLKDANSGTNLTTGLLATGLYGYDAVGANWDRALIDTLGSLYVNPGALSNTTDSITIYPPDPAYTHILTNTSTQVKSGAGYLMGISINTAGVSSNIATIYDNTSCATTVIAVLDTTAIGNVDYKGLKFNTGLCITTATGTAADMTVVYK